MDVGLHLIAGALAQRLGKGKAWLYLIVAFFSHAYIDKLNIWEYQPMNWFGYQAGATESGPLVSRVAAGGTLAPGNLLDMGFIIFSLVMFFVFLRCYWKGALFAWFSWDCLWIVNELAYLAGFQIPLLHNVMLNFLTNGPVVVVMHVFMITSLCLMAGKASLFKRHDDGLLQADVLPQDQGGV